MSASNKKRKLKLFKKSPYCYYCGRLTRIIEIPQGKLVPKDLATIDHLRSKLNSERLEKGDGRTERTVLACWECNHTSGAEEVSNLLIDEQWERSGRRPQNQKEDENIMRKFSEKSTQELEYIISEIKIGNIGIDGYCLIDCREFCNNDYEYDNCFEMLKNYLTLYDFTIDYRLGDLIGFQCS